VRLGVSKDTALHFSILVELEEGGFIEFVPQEPRVGRWGIVFEEGIAFTEDGERQLIELGHSEDDDPGELLSALFRYAQGLAPRVSQR
jgi:hypothetical protein